MKKILLITALICCMMPVMAQKINNKIPKEMREMKKKVELLNSRANTYTEKLDSIVATDIYRELITYDERLNCKKVNIFDYDSIGNWVLNKIYDYEFDSLNRHVSSTYTNLSNEQYNYRYTIKYDDQGRIAEEINWRSIEGTWVSYYKMTYEYNAQGNLSKGTYSYIDENNEWVVEYYYEFNYENEDETQCLGYSWDESTQNYVLDELDIYHYENQLCTLEEYFLWDSEGSVWFPLIRIEYMYFDNGNLKEKTESYNTDWGGELEPYYRTQFEYDSHNNNTLTKHYLYSEDWVPNGQDENEYDLNVPITNVAGLSFRYGGFYNDKKLKEREINSDGDIEEYVFYYSNTTNVGEVSENLLIVWPNPASETLNLNGNMTQVQIYSIDGRLVMSLDKGFEAINVSALSTGSYLLKAILNDGRVATQKFMKR